MLRITAEGHPSTRLSVAGEVDLSTAPELEQELGTAITATDAEEVTVDVAEVSFMDSAGLRVLVGGLRQAEEHGVRLTVVNPQSQLRKIIEITGLAEVLGLGASSSGGRAAGTTGTQS
ncbi:MULTISPECIES: STAS domain-containing protein [Actinoalloteichus]|uniref:Anti-sigma factor antagonist n=1 Tax=Actinoalloteichus fjordicus TaxID=1612552 RepID=A0AAC9LG30_9PSEU|nr:MULTISPECIES: STAS domain-containing protein [Actinoalloteichus]APU16706.1 anti-anti-sigma factor [Actinoalloteichus fjordicus]APU22772.1 anti-anti-sigma factor [Actinoalloteichus sp. GBA129-24]